MELLTANHEVRVVRPKRGDVDGTVWRAVKRLVKEGSLIMLSRTLSPPHVRPEGHPDGRGQKAFEWENGQRAPRDMAWEESLAFADHHTPENTLQMPGQLQAWTAATSELQPQRPLTTGPPPSELLLAE